MANIIEGRSEVLVPISLLKTAELSTTEKLVCAALTLDADIIGKKRPSKVLLAERTGFCRQTVAKAMDRLEALGWYTADKVLNHAKMAGKRIEVATRLLLDTSLSAGARLMHMQLQAIKACGEILQFKYASLGQEIHKGVNSVRRAVKQLVEANWLGLEQANRVAPILLTQRNPICEFFEHMKTRARRHFERAAFKGEAIMREVLSLIVDSEEFFDDASPGFLVNPSTDERMEFDRYYPNDKVAFEFNGAQHYAATERFDEETVGKQRFRDAAKRDICAKRGVELVVIHPQDLSLTALLQKVGNRLPLRNLLGGESTVRFLESVCARYRRRSPVVIPS